MIEPKRMYTRDIVVALKTTQRQTDRQTNRQTVETRMTVSKQTVTDTAYAYRDYVHYIPKVHVYSQIPLVVLMVTFLRV